MEKRSQYGPPRPCQYAATNPQRGEGGLEVVSRVRAGALRDVVPLSDGTRLGDATKSKLQAELKLARARERLERERVEAIEAALLERAERTRARRAARPAAGKHDER